MEKKIAGLLGAAAALTTITSAQAAPAQLSEPTAATNYRELLNPIPNAVPLLKADDARHDAARLAQISVQVGHHHHHHHRGVRVRVDHHHHHHFRHHHHHHHHD